MKEYLYISGDEGTPRKIVVNGDAATITYVSGYHETLEMHDDASATYSWKHGLSEGSVKIDSAFMIGPLMEAIHSANGGNILNKWKLVEGKVIAQGGEE